MITGLTGVVKKLQDKDASRLQVLKKTRVVRLLTVPPASANGPPTVTGVVVETASSDGSVATVRFGHVSRLLLAAPCQGTEREVPACSHACAGRSGLLTLRCGCIHVPHLRVCARAHVVVDVRCVHR